MGEAICYGDAGREVGDPGPTCEGRVDMDGYSGGNCLPHFALRFSVDVPRGREVAFSVEQATKIRDALSSWLATRGMP